MIFNIPAMLGSLREVTFELYIMHLRAAISILHKVKSYVLCTETNFLSENKVKQIVEIQMRVM